MSTDGALCKQVATWQFKDECLAMSVIVQVVRTPPMPSAILAAACVVKPPPGPLSWLSTIAALRSWEFPKLCLLVIASGLVRRLVGARGVARSREYAWRRLPPLTLAAAPSVNMGTGVNEPKDSPLERPSEAALPVARAGSPHYRSQALPSSSRSMCRWYAGWPRGTPLG